jgi:hypothetical protein
MGPCSLYWRRATADSDAQQPSVARGSLEHQRLTVTHGGTAWGRQWLRGFLIFFPKILAEWIEHAQLLTLAVEPLVDEWVTPSVIGPSLSAFGTQRLQAFL